MPRWAIGRRPPRCSCLPSPPGRLRSPDQLRRPGYPSCKGQPCTNIKPGPPNGGRSGHGQEPGLWRCSSRAEADQDPSHPAQAGQQPSGELARSGEATRAEAARVQVAPISPAVPLDARGHLQHLHRSSSSRLCSHSPPLPSRGVRGVAERGRCCRLTWTSGQLIVPAFNNVTTPGRVRRKISA